MTINTPKDEEKSSLKQIPVDQLQRGQYQPRREFDPDTLAELAESIKSAGLIQPLVVRPLRKNLYEIIAGERRWRAAQLAQLDTVPCLVREFTDEQAAAVSTIENIQRQDLNPIEEAHAYLRLAEEFHYLHDEVAAIVGKSRTKVTNSIRLLKLDSRVQQFLIDNQLSAGHGKVIAGLPSDQQYRFAKLCIENAWSVRQIELEAKKPQFTIEDDTPHTDPNIARLERLVSDQFGAPVKLDADASRKGGWLKIRYYDNDTLSGLLDKIGIDYD